MPYLALAFDADAAHADAWGDALLDAGALSVDLADPHADTTTESPLYGEPGEPAETRWPVCTLTALFAGGADVTAALAAAAAAVGRPSPPCAVREVAEQDWVRLTQAQFVPLRIADRLWIVPSWCEPVDPAALNLVVDPGLAFGTGSHPTTRLCLQWLAGELVAGESVLDYGCGSGILAVAAARLGAGTVVGVDVDPQAIAASEANAAGNRASARFVLPEALAASGLGAFDVVVANILTNPLRLLAPALARRVRPGGRIVLSGILAPQADDVIAAYGDWFTISVWKADDGWVALAGTRSDAATG
ncbi:MAG: 50S ribosomal protein L11 methyltransferase [Betaproteobacteria bacterium]|nr:50S ribosomal protein L11 methyltransferase [Betaproteobacteria bacterium]MBK7082054.1 50S ribosomal protein L11 methyltransferase [Betaproteobacteria bacterium]MBK8690528.1 50S ribosomal protein L11 methyltransferase [Betaproteobacteria bacterium]MBL0289428.1 50S ribosomal protein L11 methyltransferase [Betaproteobacteria bacterium]